MLRPNPAIAMARCTLPRLRSEVLTKLPMPQSIRSGSASTPSSDSLLDRTSKVESQGSELKLHPSGCSESWSDPSFPRPRAHRPDGQPKGASDTKAPAAQSCGCCVIELYNQQLPQSALGSKSPLQAMKDWHKLKPKLFRKQPYYLPGCDS
jgi:hypothetical protein